MLKNLIFKVFDKTSSGEKNFWVYENHQHEMEMKVNKKRVEKKAKPKKKKKN